MTIATAAARRHPRFKIFARVEIAAGGETTRAHALNISPGGALVHCDDPVKTKGLVRIAISGISRSGRIAWMHGKRFGIQFMIPLDHAQLQTIVADDPRFSSPAYRDT